MSESYYRIVSSDEFIQDGDRVLEVGVGWRAANSNEIGKVRICHRIAVSRLAPLENTVTQRSKATRAE